MRAVAILATLAALIAAAPAVPASLAVSAKTLDGGAFSLAAARGDVVIVNFWATWCAPCRVELPAFEAYYQAHQADGLRILAVSEDSATDTKAVMAVAAAYHLPMALDRNARYSNSIHPSQLPLTLIFDRAGALRFDSRRVKGGAIDGATLAGIVDPLLAEPRPKP